MTSPSAIDFQVIGVAPMTPIMIRLSRACLNDDTVEIDRMRPGVPDWTPAQGRGIDVRKTGQEERGIRRPRRIPHAVAEARRLTRVRPFILNRREIS
jgi:hypothetical protein